MNVAEYKLEIVNYIINSPNEKTLDICNILLYNNSTEDFWDLLSENQKTHINKGLKDLEQGKRNDAFEILKEIENEQL